MDALYVESSALASILMEGSRDFDAAFESGAVPIMSSLTLLEVRRVRDNAVAMGWPVIP